jgi:predicted RNA-binding Zn ribbon-like protein
MVFADTAISYTSAVRGTVCTVTGPPRSWDWLGEPLAVDFANTVRRRGGEYQELLASPADAAAWAAYEHELERVPAVTARAVASRLDEVRAARDDVFAVLGAAAAGDPLPRQPGDRLNARARAHPVVAQLGDRPGTATARLVGSGGPLDELLARVAAATIALVADAGAGLALCDAPSCGQFFIRARANQRWCGPACGNRARVARHAHAPPPARLRT